MARGGYPFDAFAGDGRFWTGASNRHPAQLPGTGGRGLGFASFFDHHRVRTG
jgi:hypothetical protein